MEDETVGLVICKVLCGLEVSTVQASQIPPHQIRSSVSLWTLMWPSPTPENQPHTVTPPRQMLHLTAQCSQTSTAVRATSEPRLVRQIPRQGSVREPVSTAPESVVAYTTASTARLLTMETHPVTSAHCAPRHLLTTL